MYTKFSQIFFNVPFEVKKIIKRTGILYRVWFEIYRRNQGVPIKYFEKETLMYFDGYPRSGNTFLQHLIKNVYPTLNAVHHFHAIAPIKVALERNLIPVILLRNPIDAISSYYLKDLVMKGKAFKPGSIQTGKINQQAIDWLHYYKFVSRVLDKVVLVRFEDLIHSPEDVMVRINGLLDHGTQLDEKTLRDIVAKAKDKTFGAKDPLGASLPTKEKENAKLKVKECLKELDSYKQCASLYSRLS